MGRMRLTSFDQLATLAPVNKQAAIVTSGGDFSDALTPAQMRENLIPMLNVLKAERDASDNPYRKRELRLRIQQVELQIAEWRAKDRAIPNRERRFYELARKMLPEPTFRRLDLLAEQAVEEDRKRRVAESM